MAGQHDRVIALWSTPRSRSTAFYRMVAERGDLRVAHEPFSYLAEFGSVDVAGRVVRDEPGLIGALRELAAAGPVFFKDTTDERYPGVLADERFLAEAAHVFLIRDPARTIPSYHAVNPDLRCSQLGFEHLMELHTAVGRVTGVPPLVVDADDMVRAPGAAIEHFCRAVGIPMMTSALTWSPGALPDWAPTARWHLDAAASSGFHDRDGDYGNVLADRRLRGYLAHHAPFYRALHEQRARF